MKVRRALRLADFSHSGWYAKSTARDQSALRLRIREIAHARPRFGYPRIHVMLRREGWPVNKKRVYRWYATPWEILRQLPGLAGWLRAEVTIDQLQQTAGAESDTQAAMQMREAKRKLFARFQHQKSA